MQQNRLSPKFIPGLELSRRFYWEVVRPILDAQYSIVAHAAALIGSGSEVLGFDDATSTDHHWGPRLQLFLNANDLAEYGSAMDRTLQENLPYEFLGYPTNFGTPDPTDGGVQLLEPIEDGPVNHRVDLLDIDGYLQHYLGCDFAQPLTPADWLTFPMQKLRSLTSGEVFCDAIGLGEVLARFTWYPHDVWLYQLAAGWARIGQEEHLMGRAGIVGDEIGSALIGARLVRDVIRLAFLMERQYPPYPKWFGTAFQLLHCADDLAPVLEEALAARSWQERQAGLAEAYRTLARMHNALGVTRPMPTETEKFFGRPFQVITLHGFADELLHAINDPDMRRLTERQSIGSIDLYSDSTDLLKDVNFRRVLLQLYE